MGMALVEMNDILESRTKGVKWLLNQRNPDGSIGPVNDGMFYYRVPSAFALTGYTREALLLLDWIRSYMFSSDGDFRGEYSRKGYEDSAYTYPNSNLVCAAVLLGQFDMAFKGIDFIIRMQDKNSGGFYNFKDRPRPDQLEDIWTTSQAGLACLFTGRLDEARKTADFLQMVYDQQPDIKNRLFNVYSPSKGLVTEFPDEEAAYYVVDTKKPKQYYFMPGISAAFLSKLFMATNEDRYRELAKDYIDFSLRCSEDQFHRPQCGKVGWGSALLYQITGDTKYRDLALRVGRYLVENQQPEGYWLNISPYTEYFRTIEVTAEFVIHLDSIITATSLQR